MIPDDVLSTTPVPAQFLFPRNIPRRPLIDYEYGGVDIQDGTQGIRVKVWRGEYLDGSIVLSADGVPATTIITVPGISDFQFTFDRNMNPFIAYELTDGTCRYYWFDSLVSDFVTSTLPAGSITPRCCHDDNRDLETQTSDIILAYCRSGNLYYREQRERYTTEHFLSDQAPNGLVQIGLTRGLRMQFQLQPSV